MESYHNHYKQLRTMPDRNRSSSIRGGFSWICNQCIKVHLRSRELIDRSASVAVFRDYVAGAFRSQ